MAKPKSPIRGKAWSASGTGVRPVAPLLRMLRPDTGSERVSDTGTAAPAPKCTSTSPLGSAAVEASTQPSGETANPAVTAPVPPAGSIAAIDGHSDAIVSARLGSPGCWRTIWMIGLRRSFESACGWAVGAKLLPNQAPPTAATNTAAPISRKLRIVLLTEHLALRLFHFVGVAAVDELFGQGADHSSLGTDH